jgi:hypothetical protein
MAFVPIGMSDVSSCMIASKVKFSLAAIPQPRDVEAPLVLVRSRLAAANATA